MLPVYEWVSSLQRNCVVYAHLMETVGLLIFA